MADEVRTVVTHAKDLSSPGSCGGQSQALSRSSQKALERAQRAQTYVFEDAVIYAPA